MYMCVYVDGSCVHMGVSMFVFVFVIMCCGRMSALVQHLAFLVCVVMTCTNLFKHTHTQIPEHVFYLDLYKWPVEMPKAASGWSLNAPWFLDAHTVWPNRDRHRRGKNLVRPERVEIMWIHQVGVPPLFSFSIDQSQAFACVS